MMARQEAVSLLLSLCSQSATLFFLCWFATLLLLLAFFQRKFGLKPHFHDACRIFSSSVVAKLTIPREKMQADALSLLLVSIQFKIDFQINSLQCQDLLMNVDDHAGNLAGCSSCLIDQEIRTVRRDVYLALAPRFPSRLLNQLAGFVSKRIFEEWPNMSSERVDLQWMRCSSISHSLLNVAFVAAVDAHGELENDLRGSNQGARSRHELSRSADLRTSLLAEPTFAIAKLKLTLTVAAALGKRKLPSFQQITSFRIEHFDPVQVLSNLFIMSTGVGHYSPREGSWYSNTKF